MTERKKRGSTQPQKENEYKPTLTKKEQILQIIKKNQKKNFYLKVKKFIMKP
jgi:hypothetical protein